MSESIPGAFGAESDSDIDYADLERVTRATSSDLEGSEDDLDYSPIQIADDDDDEELADMFDDDDDDDDDDAPDAAAQEEDDDPSGAAAGQLRIGYDPSSGAIVLIDSQGTPRRLTSQDLRGTTLSLASIRAMLLNRFGRSAARNDDNDDDDDDDDDYRDGVPQYYDLVKTPQPAGIDLERSGLFSRIPAKYHQARTRDWLHPSLDYLSPSSLSSYFTSREHSLFAPAKQALGERLIPNSSGVEVSQFTSKVYSGQYSTDGDFFYTACQDFCIYIYDTAAPPRVGSKSVTDTSRSSGRTRSGFNYDWQHRTSLKTSKIVRADPSNCRWTITDAELSDDNAWLIYSSISPRSHLVRTGKGYRDHYSDPDPIAATGSDEQETVNFAGGAGGYGGFGIWSLRFSHDTREIVAGASDGQLMVYDIESKKTILRVNAHRDDVNAVAFGSDSDSNLLLSGSDDCFVKVWDRRSLSGERPSGVLVGHTEGITWVSPKGDGRYCITNGKDQAMKLWDLRMMTSDEEFDRLRLDRKNFSSGYDYRSGYYPKPRYLQHPHDTSVMTYRGHSVVSTLIRCHWSPVATTGQRYLYSGSADGKIHIYSLDGTTVSVIDRSRTHPLLNRQTGEYNDPSSWELRATPKGTGRQSRGYSNGRVTVRDVSWHPERAEMMSTSWEERGSVEGSIAVHQWSGSRGERLEDVIARESAD
ncbi:uncharacterized protein JCM15063_000952 [Sporobolomyces koalae]|uniref:uncharacterized protein n=1 Tax=Sporobolomyces koalae TaxID=500713 RepID=UPI003172C759